MKFLILLAISYFAGHIVASPFTQREKQSAHSSTRIIGGTPARRGEFPMIVQIYLSTFACGGVIVNANWIVTAAHCSTSPANQYLVDAGMTNVAADVDSLQRRSVAEIRVHPNYDPNTYANDIAVWRMGVPFQLNAYVQAANLASPGLTLSSGASAIVAGLGAESPTGVSTPSNVMQVTVPMVSDESCRAAHGQRPILPGMICAGGVAGRNACRGDSGGPLLGSPSGTLVGIVSWGSDVCGLSGVPGVYSSVAFFRNWIDANTR